MRASWPRWAMVAAALVAWAQPAAAERFELEVGKGRLLPLERPVASVFVADPAVADVEVRSPRLVYVFGRGPGETSLIAVDARDQPVRQMTLRVRYDLDAVRESLAEALPGRVIRVSQASDALLLSGEVATAAEADDAVRIASRYVVGRDASAVISKLAVTAPTQINLRVRVVEVSREALRQVGVSFDFLGRFGDVALGVATGAPVLAADGGFLLRGGGANGIAGRLRNSRVDLAGLIDLLESEGRLRVLAEPNLTALSGVPASFLAGGEYPIPVPQDNRAITIEYRRYGVSLAFVATITDGERIHLHVRPEVSSLTNAGAITLEGISVPALSTRQVETTVDLASGQSFAIAGLLQSSDIRDTRKFPGLGDLPVLGALFRSERFQRQETELVIIVTPYLVRPVDAGRLHEPTEAPRR